MAFLLHTQNIHANLAHPADREAFPLSPRFYRSLLGGDEKALKESHTKSQSREPMATTGCKPERRHSWSPVTSGTLRMRIRPLAALPVSFAHAPAALGRWLGRAPAFKPPAESLRRTSSREDLAAPAPARWWPPSIHFRFCKYSHSNSSWSPGLGLDFWLVWETLRKPPRDVRNTSERDSGYVSYPLKPEAKSR